MCLTRQERIVFGAMGTAALLGLGVLWWWRQRSPLRVVGVPAPVQSAQWDEALERARWIDVNTADVAELERLPEVGPALARRIVAYRQAHGSFHAPEDLRRVEGIGPKTFEAIQRYVSTDRSQ